MVRWCDLPISSYMTSLNYAHVYSWLLWRPLSSRKWENWTGRENLWSRTIEHVILVKKAKMIEESVALQHTGFLDPDITYFQTLPCQFSPTRSDYPSWWPSRWTGNLVHWPSQNSPHPFWQGALALYTSRQHQSCNANKTGTGVTKVTWSIQQTLLTLRFIQCLAALANTNSLKQRNKDWYQTLKLKIEIVEYKSDK